MNKVTKNNKWKDSQWKDCLTCQKFNKNNFSCAIFGFNVLSEKKYIGCGEYAKN